MGKDFYNVLDIEREVNEKELKKEFRKLEMKYHSDKNPNNVEEAQKKLPEASESSETYNILSDPKKRKIYDQI
jgi:DnaJ-class molecular chaperone